MTADNRALRHQRGVLYTVPFGVLGAAQNQSRDWVIDKPMAALTNTGPSGATDTAQT